MQTGKTNGSQDNVLKKENTSTLRCAAVVVPSLYFIFLAVIVWAVFRDYGINWDEPLQQDYGQMACDYYRTMGEDRSLFSFSNVRFYGAFFETISAFFSLSSPLGLYETRHLINGLTGWLGILGTFFLAKQFGGWRMGMLAAILLTLTPSWFGHSFNNSKDIPFATGYVWCVCCTLMACRQFPLIKPHLLVGFILALGLTLAVRIGGILLAFLLCFAAGLYLLFPRLFQAENDDTPRFFSRAGLLFISLGIIFAGSYIIMIVWWPWTHEAFFVRPLEAIRKMTAFDNGPGSVLLAGKYVETAYLPRSYLFRYMMVKLPETILFGLILGIPAAFRVLFVKKDRPDALRLVFMIVLLVSMALPVSFAVVKRSCLYDGIRHFLFIMPLLSVAAAGFIYFLLTRGCSYVVRGGVGTITLVLALSSLVTMINLHPLEYVFYNHLVGGLKGADRNYELDYWGNSYKEAVAVLQDITGHDNQTNRTYHVLVEGPFNSAAYYLPKYFQRTHGPEGAEYGIAFTRWDIDKNMAGRKVGSVSRYGVDLAVIKKMD